jgi:putative hemolysin
LVPIDDFSEHLGLTLPEQADYHTVGGLIMTQLGRIPEVGDTVVLENHRLQVERMDGLRVASVRVLRS